ncbi:MAG: efflux RND transporter periplasmic adaptor subunit [Propionicimonas sp.]
MKRKTIVATSIGAAVVLALGGGYAYSASNNSPMVGVATASVAPLSVTASASGSLVAAHSAGVYPPATGTVAKILVADGDTVKAGDILAVMGTGPLKLAVAQARAALSTARAQGEAVSNGVPSAIDRSAASAALSAARSQVSTANLNYASFRADYDSANSAERQMLRTLRTARTQASAALKAAQAALSRLSVASRVSLARTAASQGVTAAGQALKLAEGNLGKAELRAPFDGTVTFGGTVEKGSGLTPGVAAFTIIDPTRMEFQAAVNETDIADVARDEAATVTLDAFAEGFTGTVTRVQASPETTSTGSVAFAVRVSFDAGKSRLFQGMSGSVDIAVKSIPDALTVPVEAVLTRGATRSVFVLGSETVVHARTVTVGASTDSSAQILSGLAAGDTVVTTGASGLSDGQRVRTQ